MLAIDILEDNGMEEVTAVKGVLNGASDLASVIAVGVRRLAGGQWRWILGCPALYIDRLCPCDHGRAGGLLHGHAWWVGMGALAAVLETHHGTAVMLKNPLPPIPALLFPGGGASETSSPRSVAPINVTAKDTV